MEPDSSFNEMLGLGQVLLGMAKDTLKQELLVGAVLGGLALFFDFLKHAFRDTVYEQLFKLTEWLILVVLGIIFYRQFVQELDTINLLF